MPLTILTFSLGPLENNCYLVADDVTGEAVVIDPSFDSQVVLEQAQLHRWQITRILLTHAHFDHMAGAGQLAGCFTPPLPVYLHPGDLALYRLQGHAPQFGFHLDDLPEVTQPLEDGQRITIGCQGLDVFHTPGHSPGHVIFYSAEAAAAFTGDLIFSGSVGRTDLPGGDNRALLRSIRARVLTLPSHTRLLSGHGPETTVQDEMDQNPFL